MREEKMSEEKMSEYKEMSEEQVLSFIGELREYILDVIRKVERFEEEVKKDERQIEEAGSEQDIEKVAQIYSGAIERLKRRNEEMQRMNSKGGVQAKIQQLKDIYRLAKTEKIETSAAVALSFIAMRFEELKP